MIYSISILLIFIAFLLRYNIWRIPVSYTKARILMYHSISKHCGDKFDKWRVEPKDFERQIKWMKNHGFTSYKISELVNSKTISKKSVAITFDDGYEDNFKNAFEILKKYGFKATIYLVPNQNTNHWEKANTNSVSNMLNAEQIAQMQNSNLIEFGSHTLSHKNLSTLGETELKNELQNSKLEVEKLTGKTCKAFAYPYGKFNEKIITATKDAGYENAVIVKRGVFESRDDKFTIKRIGVLGTESFFDFYLKFTRIRNKL
ncbi:polysaccharide deacetylase family protein [Campylobacter hyointestinalis]|uniref:Polysaccharide deacetylase family protein n=2 Tax=Campylobacter hyointestinalis TaxID=198 RepID=A0AAV6EGT0_CAMHY|nr:polysaccharide deacetylase family protein [Campylobacter hyointestinalis]KAB0614208.1 polysaccharide deacetylase family protein [Campylobacter hyointestinalis subsp. lawsonii]QKF69953.1 polysaccharide deacetylase [Campylobacter hyointestinalis subsp. lawsonii]